MGGDNTLMWFNYNGHRAKSNKKESEVFDEFKQNFDGFDRLFTGESVSSCHFVVNVGFSEGA
jgi:hypothetical protein